MKYSKNKEIHNLVRRLLKEFDFEVKSKNNHLKLWNDEKKVTIIVPQTPSDGRAVLNFFADVRRLGFAT